MTVWTVEKDARGWSVVAYRDGERVEARRTLTGLPCVAAKVLRDELERAYAQGGVDARARVFETIGE